MGRRIEVCKRTPRHAHSQPVRVRNQDLMATVIKVGNGRCDARCHEAKQPDCDCICGGRYHGALLKGPEELEKRLEDDKEWILNGVNKGDIADAQTPLFSTQQKPTNKEST